MTPEQAVKAADKMNLQGPMREAFLKRAQAPAAPAATPAAEAAPARIAPVAQPKPQAAPAAPRPQATKPPPAFQPLGEGGMVQPEPAASPAAYTPDYTAKPWATMTSVPMEREKPPGANSPPPMMPPQEPSLAYRAGAAISSVRHLGDDYAREQAAIRAKQHENEQRVIDSAKRGLENASAYIGSAVDQFRRGVQDERAGKVIQPPPPPPKAPSTASAPPVVVRPTKPAPQPVAQQAPRQPTVEEMLNVLVSERGYKAEKLKLLLDDPEYGQAAIANLYRSGVRNKFAAPQAQ